MVNAEALINVNVKQDGKAKIVPFALDTLAANMEHAKGQWNAIVNLDGWVSNVKQVSKKPGVFVKDLHKFFKLHV